MLVIAGMLAVLLVVSVSDAAAQGAMHGAIIISGNADFPERNTLGFFEAYPKYNGDHRLSDTIGIKNDGTFYKKVVLNGVRLCVLTMGCHRLVRFLYAAPGDSIHATITLPGTVPVVEFSGPHARLHDFMNRYDEQLSSIRRSADESPRDLDSLIAHRKRLEAKLERFYHSYFGRESVPPHYAHAVMTDIKCRLPSAVISHIMGTYYHPMNRGESPLVAWNEDEVDIEALLPRADTLAVRIPHYQQLLVKYGEYLGFRKRVAEMQRQEPFLESLCTYTTQEVLKLQDTMLREAILYSTILFNARLPFAEYKQCAREMLAAFRVEVRDYRYYVSAKEKVEGE